MMVPHSPALVPTLVFYAPTPIPSNTETGLSGRKQGSWDIFHSQKGDARLAAAEQVILVFCLFFFLK